MPALPVRRQQPNPVTPQVPIPNEFPAIPQEILDRFPSAKDWQTKLNEFWGRTNQALQEAQRQTASQVNSQVVWSVDRFLIYTNDNGTMPMFALDATGIRLGNVLVINTPDRKVYIGAGEYANNNTPFYIDTLGRFSLGANLTWNPDTSTLNITGIINATSGTIGGFDIGADYIRDTGNSFGLSSAVAAGTDVRFWAGDTFANRGSAPFRVYENGQIALGGSGAPDVNVSLQISSNRTAVGGSAGHVFLYGNLEASANNDSLFSSSVNLIFDNNAFTGVSVYGYFVYTNSVNTGIPLANSYGVYVSQIATATNRYAFYSASGTGHSTFIDGIDSTPIGATTPGTGAFTTLAASSTVSGSGFSTYLASPPAIGGTAAAAGAFTTLSASSVATVTGVGVNGGGFFSGTANYSNHTNGAWEVGYNGSVGFSIVYDRTASAYKPMQLGGSTVELQTGGNTRLLADASGAITIANLSGVGSRTVVADANGVLSAP